MKMIIMKAYGSLEVEVLVKMLFLTLAKYFYKSIIHLLSSKSAW